VYGYGPLSTVSIVRTSDVPDTQNPVITLSVLSTFVISWETPSNGGEAIDYYQPEILTPQNVFVQDATCTGALSFGTSCLFNNLYLIETYGFKVGDIVKARVRAHNKNGLGAFS